MENLKVLFSDDGFLFVVLNSNINKYELKVYQTFYQGTTNGFWPNLLQTITHNSSLDLSVSLSGNGKVIAFEGSEEGNTNCVTLYKFIKENTTFAGEWDGEFKSFI
jgi:hypothetical protein